MNELKTLNNDQKIEYIKNAYFVENKSIPDIARELETYTNAICRFCRKNGIELKGKSKALKDSYKAGRREPPMKGKTHDHDTKLQISERNAAAWSKLTPEERERRSKVSKENWENRTEKEKEEFQKRSNKAIRKASEAGSKLERYLLKALIEAGYKVDFHVERRLVNTKLQVDILLQNEGIVVEVDGLSHIEPIWGEESFKRTKKADDQKNSLLLSNGYVVIRLRQTRDLSQKLMRDAATALLKKLQEIAINGKPKREDRYIVIEV
jgi:very-short-patch-repair endonuclease